MIGLSIPGTALIITTAGRRPPRGLQKSDLRSWLCSRYPPPRWWSRLLLAHRSESATDWFILVCLSLPRTAVIFKTTFPPTPAVLQVPVPPVLALAPCRRPDRQQYCCSVSLQGGRHVLDVIGSALAPAHHPDRQHDFSTATSWPSSARPCSSGVASPTQTSRVLLLARFLVAVARLSLLIGPTLQYINNRGKVSLPTA